jgi:hypothetical protein
MQISELVNKLNSRLESVRDRAITSLCNKLENSFTREDVLNVSREDYSMAVAVLQWINDRYLEVPRSLVGDALRIIEICMEDEKSKLIWEEAGVRGFLAAFFKAEPSFGRANILGLTATHAEVEEAETPTIQAVNPIPSESMPLARVEILQSLSVRIRYPRNSSDFERTLIELNQVLRFPLLNEESVHNLLDSLSFGIDKISMVGIQVSYFGLAISRTITLLQFELPIDLLNSFLVFATKHLLSSTIFSLWKQVASLCKEVHAADCKELLEIIQQHVLSKQKTDSALEYSKILSAIETLAEKVSEPILSVHANLIIDKLVRNSAILNTFAQKFVTIWKMIPFADSNLLMIQSFIAQKKLTEKSALSGEEKSALCALLRTHDSHVDVVRLFKMYKEDSVFLARCAAVSGRVRKEIVQAVNTYTDFRFILEFCLHCPDIAIRREMFPVHKISSELLKKYENFWTLSGLALIGGTSRISKLRLIFHKDQTLRKNAALDLWKECGTDFDFIEDPVGFVGNFRIKECRELVNSSVEVLTKALEIGCDLQFPVVTRCASLEQVLSLIGSDILEFQILEVALSRFSASDNETESLLLGRILCKISRKDHEEVGLECFIKFLQFRNPEFLCLLNKLVFSYEESATDLSSVSQMTILASEFSVFSCSNHISNSGITSVLLSQENLQSLVSAKIHMSKFNGVNCILERIKGCHEKNIMHELILELSSFRALNLSKEDEGLLKRSCELIYDSNQIYGIFCIYRLQRFLHIDSKYVLKSLSQSSDTLFVQHCVLVLARSDHPVPEVIWDLLEIETLGSSALLCCYSIISKNCLPAPKQLASSQCFREASEPALICAGLRFSTLNIPLQAQWNILKSTSEVALFSELLRSLVKKSDLIWNIDMIEFFFIFDVFWDNVRVAFTSDFLLELYGGYSGIIDSLIEKYTKFSAFARNWPARTLLLLKKGLSSYFEISDLHSIELFDAIDSAIQADSIESFRSLRLDKVATCKHFDLQSIAVVDNAYASAALLSLISGDFTENHFVLDDDLCQRLTHSATTLFSVGLECFALTRKFRPQICEILPSIVDKTIPQNSFIASLAISDPKIYSQMFNEWFSRSWENCRPENRESLLDCLASVVREKEIHKHFAHPTAKTLTWAASNEIPAELSLKVLELISMSGTSWAAKPEFARVFAIIYRNEVKKGRNFHIHTLEAFAAVLLTCPPTKYLGLFVLELVDDALFFVGNIPAPIANCLVWAVCTDEQVARNAMGRDGFDFFQKLKIENSWISDICLEYLENLV